MKYKIFFALVFMVSILIPVLLKAQVTSRAFGGKRIVTEPCTDRSFTMYAITLLNFSTPPRPLRLSYIPGRSKIFLNYNVLTSRYLLGSYAPFERQECNGVFTDGTLNASPGTGFSFP